MDNSLLETLGPERLRSARHRLRGVMLALAAAVLAGAAASLAAAWLLTQPAHRPVPLPSQVKGLEVVSFRSPSGNLLRGWLLAPPSPRAGAVLLHGLRADRREMLGRGRLLRHAGFAVLLLDLQAHGESGGSRMTFGHLESRDALAAVDYIREKLPGIPVAGIGLSLGGAAFALAGESVELDALVLEAAYPTIERAARNRVSMRLPAGADLATSILLAGMRPLLGIRCEDLRPVDHLGRVRCPVFVIAGTADPLTTEEDSRLLFAAAPLPRALWLVPGAGHEDILRLRPDEYRRRILGFLSRHIGVPAADEVEGLTKGS